MIFITTGFQFPFDRLIKAIDQVAPELDVSPIIAQIAQSNYEPSNMEILNFVSPTKFNSYLTNAKLIISHAGMGTIISALELNKPIIVMPRLKKYGEVTTDHQLATARELEKLNYIYVAYNEGELQHKLINIWNEGLPPLHKINKYASDQLLTSIEAFMNS